MRNPLPELSSISSSLDILSQRLAKLAEESTLQGRDEMAQELFEVERSLTNGRRRLARLVDRE